MDIHYINLLETVNKPMRMKNNKIKVVVTVNGIEYDTIITKIFPVFLPILTSPVVILFAM